MIQSKNRVQKMVLTALFAALTAVCSQIAIPTPWGVPFHLALFSIFVTGAVLGPVWGCASQLIYTALACVGVPVLAGFNGGAAALVGKTGGYVIGYIPMVIIAGYFAVRFKHNKWWMMLGMLLGTVVCYLFGSIWFIALTKVDIVTCVTLCVLPYLVPDVIKMLLAALLVEKWDRVYKIDEKI